MSRNSNKCGLALKIDVPQTTATCIRPSRTKHTLDLVDKFAIVK